MKKSPELYIGTSGWSYDAWKGAFYPEKMAKTKYLEHYAASFSSVELSTTFQQLPPAKTVFEFAGAVPDSFLFSARANRYITHIKKLNEGRTILPPFLNRMDLLGKKMGPVLFELPSNWSFNAERLKSFLGALPKDRRFVFEFHDPSWFNDTAYSMLAEKNAALGIFQLGEKITPRVATADFIYLRLAKPKVKSGEKIAGLVKTWVDDFEEWSGSGKDIFCYFYQAGSDCAITDALRFRSALDDAMGAPVKKTVNWS